MFKVRRLFFVVILWPLFCAQSFASELFTYTIKSYPKATVSCQEAARSLGERFTQATGKAIYSAVCDREDPFDHSFDLSIVYVSDEEIPLVSTSQGHGESENRLSIYSSKEECTRHLSQELIWFEEATGLSPFLAYCYKEYWTQTPYSIRIDAFGHAAQYPFSFEGSYFGELIDHRAAVLQDILEKAKAAGINATLATTAGDDSLPRLVVRYYDPPENSDSRFMYFSLDQITKYVSSNQNTTMAACRSQLVAATAIFSRELANPVVWFCTWDPLLFHANLFLFQIKPESLFPRTIFHEILPTRFIEFSECDLKREKTIEFYRNELGKEAYGALCAWDDRFGSGQRAAYIMQIYIKR